MTVLGFPTVARPAPSPILGQTAAIQAVRRQIQAVAGFPEVAVLLIGETGTGKELVARAVHDETGSGGPFVAVNCAAIPEHLVESELFGHEAGAFTGARTARTGLMEEARDGTLFLDEVGEMPLRLQSKLLRALETRTFRRLGSNRDQKLSARVVSATNGVDVGSAGGALRSDLYYRLAGFRMDLPPLRERSDDVVELAEAFLCAFQRRHGTGPRRLTMEAKQTLEDYDWPGNVRELKLVVERAAIVACGDFVCEHDLALRPSGVREMRPPVHAEPRKASQPGVDLRALERELILQEFRAGDGNLSRAARKLGIPRTTLRAKLRRYGVL